VTTLRGGTVYTESNILPNNICRVDDHIQVTGVGGATGVGHHHPAGQQVQPGIRQPDLD
jgi:hypothetical protein